MKMQEKSLIENGFPFEKLSIVAEQESWRKEINRPTSYIHKWWARRLGSVFRGLIIGGCEDETADFFDKYYDSTTYIDKVIYDPFMGSGTTVNEAIKLGAKAIGTDINPVATTIVKTALQKYSYEDVIETYNNISIRCGDKIKKYYKAIYNDETVDVLYYFWVRTLNCNKCDAQIPLYKTTIFSKNAYVKKKPAAKSICPHCRHINDIQYNDTTTECKNCHNLYNPQQGNVNGQEYLCPHCGHHERIVDYLRRTKTLLGAMMYAKMVIDSKGVKHYAEITRHDKELYSMACDDVLEFDQFIPQEKIHSGINTNQILNYNFNFWKDMFNNRQLLAFAILSKEILSITDFTMRRLFAVLMSGTLEFNNMFCSFKGEGTGAVRPLFFNHILKNELMPLEANPWGCKASSGSFSTLFESRILRMMAYKEHPFEIKVLPEKKSEKFNLNCRMEANIISNEQPLNNMDALIMCKDSAHTNIPSGSVDLIVTDPPFFDNVNYSELADFFYVWLKRLNIGLDNINADTTRASNEVQDNNPQKFSSKLRDVFLEGNRVLKENGMLLFTYHHSRPEGWVSVYNAVSDAGFSISQVIPLKAEMAVSVPIMSAKEPINYDLVFICRKKDAYDQCSLFDNSLDDYERMVQRIQHTGLKFSKGDKWILLYGITLKHLSKLGVEKITKDDIDKITSTVRIT